MTEDEKKKAEAERLKREAEAAVTAEPSFPEKILDFIRDFLKFFFGAFSDDTQAPDFDDVHTGASAEDIEVRRAAYLDEARKHEGQNTTKLGNLIVDASALTTWAATIEPHAKVTHYSPVAEQTVVTSPYGMRKLDGEEKQRMHHGLDFGARGGNENPDIIASADGIVIFSGWKSGYGNTVMVGHKDGSYTLYGHLASINEAAAVGKPLTQGQTLGVMGETGRSFGVHLHYEQRVGSHSRNPEIATGIGREAKTFKKGEPLSPASPEAVAAIEAAKSQFYAGVNSPAGAARTPVDSSRARSA